VPNAAHCRSRGGYVPARPRYPEPLTASTSHDEAGRQSMHSVQLAQPATSQPTAFTPAARQTCPPTTLLPFRTNDRPCPPCRPPVPSKASGSNTQHPRRGATAGPRRHPLCANTSRQCRTPVTAPVPPCTARALPAGYARRMRRCCNSGDAARSAPAAAAAEDATTAAATPWTPAVVAVM